jgi:replicative DNA helicase
MHDDTVDSEMTETLEVVEELPPLLSIDDVLAEIKERQQREKEELEQQARTRYQFVRPFTTAAEGLIEYAQNPEGRFMLGIRDIDAMTRGFGRGELIYVTGRAHSGKTQICLNAIVNNPQKRILIFTPDEVSELVLSKLVSMRYGISAELVEKQIKEGDEKTIEMVRTAAAKDFRNVIVIDDSLTLGQMANAYDEAVDWWGQPADAVIIDFLELIPGDDGADGVVAKSQALKRWTKEKWVPVICLHQASRSSAPRGVSAGMNAMRYGGETEAIMVLEVFRKRENEALDEWERDRHKDTITVNLAKNKRPPSKKGEVDLHIDPETGSIRALRHEDLYPQQPQNNPRMTAEQVMSQFTNRELF